ncbi:MAG: A24 family peptidase [Treponema sp.]|jgi:prepilin signal peptidase PulO-like enzyme (type II secretory pathway)|nr:A24 family peptidase [Treponema sp.]
MSVPFIDPRLAVFCCFGIIITVCDVREMRIPDPLLVLLALSLLLCDLIPARGNPSVFAGRAALRLPAAFLTFAALYLLYRVKGGIGLGDVKYAAVMAYFNGAPAIISALLAACLGALAVWGAGALFFRWDAKRRIPFAPFLSAGAVAASLLSESVLPL